MPRLQPATVVGLVLTSIVSPVYGHGTVAWVQDSNPSPAGATGSRSFQAHHGLHASRFPLKNNGVEADPYSCNGVGGRIDEFDSAGGEPGQLQWASRQYGGLQREWAIPGRWYTGSEVDIGVHITANHGGIFEFRHFCADDKIATAGPGDAAQLETLDFFDREDDARDAAACYERNPGSNLWRAGRGCFRPRVLTRVNRGTAADASSILPSRPEWYILSTGAPADIDMRYVLPAEPCDHLVLQWWWTTTNNCLPTEFISAYDAGIFPRNNAQGPNLPRCDPMATSDKKARAGEQFAGLMDFRLIECAPSAACKSSYGPGLDGGATPVHNTTRGDGERKRTVTTEAVATLPGEIAAAAAMPRVETVLGRMENIPQELKPRHTTTASKFKLAQGRVGTGIDALPEDKVNGMIASINAAADSYPGFLAGEDPDANSKELCAFMTIINWETDFVFFEEVSTRDSYVHPDYPSVPGKSYHGRGPKQLSWNYNYLAFSQQYFGDDRLIHDPDLVVRDPVVMWASALFFWFYEGANNSTNYGGWCQPQGRAEGQWPCQQTCSSWDGNPLTDVSGCDCAASKPAHFIRPGKQSAHSAIHVDNSMPKVINIVNGGYDCCPTTSYGPRSNKRGHTRDRMASFSMCLDLFGLAEDHTVVDAFQECPALSATTPECPDCSCLDCARVPGAVWMHPWQCTPTPCPAPARSSPDRGADTSSSTSASSLLTHPVTLIGAAQRPSLLPADYSQARVLASQAVRPGTPPSTLQEISAQPNVARLLRVFPAAKWGAIFAHANAGAGAQGSPYNYHNLMAAAWKFPRFCGEDSQTDESCLHELTAMFAHFVQETGGHRAPAHLDGLYHLRELGCYDAQNPDGGSCTAYCQDGGVWSRYPCGGRSYYGRGAKQLSWNYNYAFFSKAMTGTADTYLLHPDRIVTDGWPALASAIWFWMTPQSPKPSMHEVVTGLWRPNTLDTAAGVSNGFGTTTNIINGGIECGKSTETSQSRNRIAYYRALCADLGTACFATAGDTCATMGHLFPTGGTAGSGPAYYLDRVWTGARDCKRVVYQMPWVATGATATADRQACICHYWPDTAGCAASSSSRGETGGGDIDSNGNAGRADPATATMSPTRAATTLLPRTSSSVGCTDSERLPEWASCRDTKCCAEGLRCYETSRYWASCRKTCTRSSTSTCNILAPNGAQDGPATTAPKTTAPATADARRSTTRYLRGISTTVRAAAGCRPCFHGSSGPCQNLDNTVCYARAPGGQCWAGTVDCERH